MRKLIIGIILAFALVLTECGQNTQETLNANNTEADEEAEVESGFKFPEGQRQVGNGIILCKYFLRNKRK